MESIDVIVLGCIVALAIVLYRAVKRFSKGE